MTMDLYMPFAPRRHPAADVVQRQSVAWADAQGLAHRTDREGYGVFMAIVYPDAHLPALQWIADFTAWLFALDDLCDEAELGRDLVGLGAAHQAILTTFMHSAAPLGDDPLVRAAADLAQRLDHLQPGERWRGRFLVHITAYCDANRWEAQNRRRNVVPSREEYLAWRPLTSSVYVYLAFVELAQQLHLDRELADARVLRLSELTNLVVSLGNDLASLHKEQASGDVHNLPLVLVGTEAMPLAQAVAETVRLHNDAVRAFETLRAEVRPQGPLATYLDGHEHWMSANTVWGRTTVRYNSNG